MLTAADNELLTRAGAETGLGQYFRRFWLPVALSCEIPELDGPPIRVRVMHEDLILFRDSDGRVGLTEPHCPHRGANLFYGRNEQGGLRCVFHGWKFNVDGRCLDMPNTPDDSSFRDRIRLKSYPTREYAEMVWAYLGPAGGEAEVPQLEVGMLPATHRFVTKKLQQCNWAQSIEGALDTAHFSFLHMPAPSVPDDMVARAPLDIERLRWVRHDPLPRFNIIEHEVGFVIGAARDAAGRGEYWRTTQYMLPSHATTPSTLPGENYFGYTWVPIDDRSCWIYSYVWNPERAITEDERAMLRAGHGIVAEVDANYVPLRNRENDYLIDRNEQKYATYTGIKGIAEQDAMVQDSQGFIADRTRENLVATDLGITRFRKVLLGGVKALAAGTEPTAPRAAAAYCLRSGSYISDDEKPFADVMEARFGDRTGRADAHHVEKVSS